MFIVQGEIIFDFPWVIFVCIPNVFIIMLGQASFQIIGIANVKFIWKGYTLQYVHVIHYFARLRSHWLTTSRHPFRVIKSHRPARLYQSRRSEAKTDGSGRGNSFRVYAKCNCANLRYRNRHIPICLFACLTPLPSGVLRPWCHNYQKLNPE